MEPEIPAAIASSLEGLNHSVQVLWHGGEPLVTGINRFCDLLAPFEKLRSQTLVRHSLQTNATLITDEWCRIFKEYNFHVGVSIDGPAPQNANRIKWNGDATYDNVLKGVEKLKKHSIRFVVISVVSSANFDEPQAFYDFFRRLGCSGLAINVAEQEGLNRFGHIVEEQRVRDFWQGLFEAWLEHPDLRVREFDGVIGWLRVTAGSPVEIAPRYSDMWPTVSTSGDVVVLSPELMASNPDEYPRFIIGNVLEESFSTLVERSRSAWYVKEFFDGVSVCRQECPYFSYCGGGQGSNKYYETGSFKATETRHCRNHRQALVDAVLGQLEAQAQIQKGDATNV